MSNKRYRKEFKLEAIKLVSEQGLTQSQAGKDLGVSQSILGRWCRSYKRDVGEAFPGKGKLVPQDAEFRQLQKELRTVRMERDILKKAIAYFAEVPK